MTTSPGAGPDGADQFGSPNLPDPNPPFGGNYLSAKQILGLEMIAAQNSFAMTSPWGVIQGTFPPACDACDVMPPVVDDAFAPASDFFNLNWSNPTADPLFGGTFGISVWRSPRHRFRKFRQPRYC